MSAREAIALETVVGATSYLTLGAWRCGPNRYEFASRKRLDTRLVVPYFVLGGVCHAGILHRERPARALRGAPLMGYEAIGFDFTGVDETADIHTYGEAMFGQRSGLVVDPDALAIPLPSFARSVGYLTELALPIAIGVRLPHARTVPVAWDGVEHEIDFRPVETWLADLASRDAPPHGEELEVLLRVLSPPSRDVGAQRSDNLSMDTLPAARFTDAASLATAIHAPIDWTQYDRLADPAPEDSQFLRVSRTSLHGRVWEIVTPNTGVSLAMVPYVRVGSAAAFLLWEETRVAVLERHVRQPMYDLPLRPRYVNATASFVGGKDSETLARATGTEDIHALVSNLLSRAMGRSVDVRSIEWLGSAAEPAPGVSSELRYRVACEVAPNALSGLPSDAVLISAYELATAIDQGTIRDPVLVSAMLRLGPRFGCEPLGGMRVGTPSKRRAFVSAMTSGSIVQRRLQRYSGIESEQLEAPTYARLMTLLQHEFGVRVAYPKSESDRSFFKAAFRVFMAADRNDNRALQGLHWSHDAFHFALGNYTPPPSLDVRTWYVSDDPMPPEIPPAGEAWEAYALALKSAEDEATFFSFWTLYAENLSLAKHVGKLTYFEALRDMGIMSRSEARAIFDSVTTRATLPVAIEQHAVYAARAEVRSLFDYMLGFREYHLKDIRTAWKSAARDPYRAFFLRFAIYEHRVDRYVASVRAFQSRLERQSPGLNPLLAACADARVSVCLRVWDVVKALKLVRTASNASTQRLAMRTQMLGIADQFLAELESRANVLAILRERVAHAEPTTGNESVFDALQALETDLDHIRAKLWDTLASAQWLTPDAIAAERVRELPR